MTTEFDSAGCARRTGTGRADIPETVARLRKTFASGRTRSVEWRKQQLKALGAMITENEAAVAAALEQDLGRNSFEAWLADIASDRGRGQGRGEARPQVDAAQATGCWRCRSCPAAAGSSTSRTAPC